LIQFLELLDHLLWLLVIRMDHAQLRRRLNQGCLRRSDGREGLIEIGRHLTEISAFGLLRQPQRDADLMYIRHCLSNVRLCNR